MIAAGVDAGITKYDCEVSRPRHEELKSSLASNHEGINKLQSVMTEVNGGLKALRWMGSLLIIAVGAGGGLIAWAKLLGH